MRFADDKEKLESEITKLRSSHGGALAAVEEQLRTAKQNLLAKQTALTEVRASGGSLWGFVFCLLRLSGSYPDQIFSKN